MMAIVSVFAKLADDFTVDARCYLNNAFYEHQKKVGVEKLKEKK